ncbi:MAG TPA: restriction endonuclease, partial [Armatimonadota bacterium]|nr:restriction endonuclease [Armatimonadota bacterium]
IQVALGVQDKLHELYEECIQLVSDNNHQQRGFRLEKIMRELFLLFDLDPRASFKIDGEQIDGAFTFDSTDFLFEAKWHNNQIGISDLDAFKGKVKRKLENTLGLFLSMSGFSEGAVRQFASTERRVIILMDGLDLMAVLEGRIELPRLLLYKRRQAAETGNIYYKVNDILA